jgi:hypothetical protein
MAELRGLQERKTSKVIRRDWVLTGLVIFATGAVIFIVVVVASASGVLLGEGDDSNPTEGIAGDVAEEQTLPRSDLPGRDLPNVERYPQSVRVKYERYELGEAEVVEIGYLTDSGVEDVGEFYESYGSFTQDNAWRTASSDVSQDDEFGILIVRDDGEAKRQVLIEIEPHGELVSVELEETTTDSL